jgi:hypothetical protein
MLPERFARTAGQLHEYASLDAFSITFNDRVTRPPIDKKRNP